MELEGRTSMVDIDMPLRSELAKNLKVLEAACIVAIDQRASHKAISLMFQRFLMVEEDIKVADLIWDHKVYLVTFPSVELARTVAKSGPESFEGFRFYCKLWELEWNAVSIDAHLAVWVEVSQLSAHFYDSIIVRYILECFGFILRFSQNFFRRDNMESFSVLLAVSSTRVIPKTLRLKTGIFNYKVSLKPVSVSAVTANVHLEEQRWEFLTQGERYFRANIFDRPWDMPIDPYLAGFPEGCSGFCDHCHLHRRYCTIGNRAPPLVVLSESSQDTGGIPHHLNDNHEGTSVNQNGHLINGEGGTLTPTDGQIISSPPADLHGRIGEVDDDQIVALYGTLSSSAHGSFRRRGNI